MITFKCRCGKVYRVEDRLAGREAKCQQCLQTFIIPTPKLVASPSPHPVPKPIQQVSVPPMKIMAFHDDDDNSEKESLISRIASKPAVWILLSVVVACSVIGLSVPGAVRFLSPAKSAKQSVVAANNNTTDGLTEESDDPLYESPFEDILSAAEKGTVADVRYFVEQGANVHTKNINGFMALHFAAGQSDVKMVLYLLKNQADVNGKDRLGNSPLHWAVRPMGQVSSNRKISIDLLKILIENGAEVNARTNDGATPLYHAIGYNIDAIKYLVEQGADVNIKAYGSAPLLRAVTTADAETLKYLIEQGADVNAKDSHGKTPLDLVMNTIVSFRNDPLRGPVAQATLDLAEKKERILRDAGGKRGVEL